MAVIEDDGTIGTIKRKSTLQILLPGALTVDVFCTSKIWGGQDHVFLF
jgi:hypothetical protein